MVFVLPSGPAPLPICRPISARWGASSSRHRRGLRGIVEVVLLALSLERACQFIKAFGERGGDLHVTQRQHGEVRLMPLYQHATTI